MAMGSLQILLRASERHRIPGLTATDATAPELRLNELPPAGLFALAAAPGERQSKRDYSNSETLSVPINHRQGDSG